MHSDKMSPHLSETRQTVWWVEKISAKGTCEVIVSLSGEAMARF